QEQQPKLSPLQTGNDLLHVCQSDNIFDRGVCGGFITAASQVVQMAGKACFAEGMTLEQGRDVVVKYLSGHPETRHEAAVTLASRALMRAFPCSIKPKE
ncbi:MAG: Rap1a/Tai family immunity protein, partial [Candidatus Acidiferrum sp.]